MSSKHERAKALERLKASKEGRKVEMELSDDEILKDVSDGEYEKHKQENALDDFVVDDDGRGYAEDGRDWWEHDENSGVEDMSECEDDSRIKSKRGKRRDVRKKEKKKADPNQKSINKLFSAMGTKAAAAAAPTVVDIPVPKDDFLSDLLTDLNEDPLARKSVERKAYARNRVARGAADIALMGTMSEANILYSAPDVHSSDVDRHNGGRFNEYTNHHVEDVVTKIQNPQPIQQVSACESKRPGSPRLVKREVVIKQTEVKMDTSAESKLDIKLEPKPASAQIVEDMPMRLIKKEIKVMDFDDNPEDEDIELDSATVCNDQQDWWQIRADSIKKERKDLAASKKAKFESEIATSLKFPSLLSSQEETKTALSASSNLPVVMVKMSKAEKENAQTMRASHEEDKMDDDEKHEVETEAFRFFYMDIVEDQYKRPGTLYVIGKVWNEATSQFESCCVTINGIERNLFVLPREVEVDRAGLDTDREVSFQTVYKEFDTVMEKYGVMKWEASMVTRSYAFEYVDVPSTSEYLKVKYPMSGASLPMDLSGTTFSRVFGTNTSATETFLLKRKLMGPTWLDVRGFKRSTPQISWCKWEIEIDGYKSVSKTMDAPPVPTCRLAAISLKTVLSSKTHKHEIVGISVIAHKGVSIEGQTEKPEADYDSFSIIRPLAGTPLPFDFESTVKQQQLNITCANNERSLLSLFIAKFHKLDPDFLVGHNLFGFDLDILLHRMQDCKVSQWSKLGRLRRTIMPKLSGSAGASDSSYGEKLVLGGRLGVCMWTSARELIKVKTYSLEELAKTQLNKDRQRLDFEQIPGMYGATKNLIHLMRHCENDTYLIVSLMFKIMTLPLSRQITSLAGNLWARTLSGGRAERNEYLLLHEFHDRKYIVPDKQRSGKWKKTADEDGEEDRNGDGKSSKSNPRRKKAQYAGGLVLEPKKGFYDTFILLLDFNSLYPSIIQEYNVCFTTVSKSTTEDSENVIPDVPDSSLSQGILPYILATLVERRKIVKNLIKNERNPGKLTQLNIRQLAFKLTANSMYGCLGFSHSRFYAKPLAALVTSKGREILENTVTLARNALNLDVIYGDTDSIMVNTNKKDLKEVLEIGNKVKKEVNKLYRLLEIDIDGVYKSMLLLKKKKYAALMVKEVDGKFTTVQETKGLDIVRRDWCGLSHKVGNDVLTLILSEETTGEDLANCIHDLLRAVGEKVKNGEIPIEKYTINKGLTKMPEDYPDRKNQPHVQVALRMRSRGQNVQAKDTIPYVICEDATKQSLADRAYHPNDLAKDDELKIDTKYYLKQQIHPVVTRLCEPIPGTDARMIAECLGLDASSYHVKNEDESDNELIYKRTQISDEEKYRDAERLNIKCPTCNAESEYTSIVRGDLNSMTEVECAMTCQRCTKPLPPAYLCNVLTRLVRSYITKYYAGWLVCDDQACRTRTRYVSVCGRKCMVPFCRGSMSPEYSAHQLFTQLAYFQYLFDLALLLKKSPAAANMTGLTALSKEGVESLTNPYKDDIARVHTHMTSFIQKNARTYVDLSQIFGSLSMAIAPKMAPGAN
eukprot:CFRG8271T1